MAEHNQEPALEWPLAAYGKIIRGDETTSEDQVAEACSAEMARRLVACWNACAGMSIELLETMPAPHIDIMTGLMESHDELLAALKEVVAISDRKHDAWDRAHAAIDKAEMKG